MLGGAATVRLPLAFTPAKSLVIAGQDGGFAFYSTATGERLAAIFVAAHADAAIVLAGDRCELLGAPKQAQTLATARVGARVVPFELVSERLSTGGLLAGLLGAS